jgi:hypothetical protein
MASDGRFAAFDRLSSREKLMVGGLGVFFFVGIVVVVVLLVSSFLSGIEEEIALAEEKAQKIELAASNYLEIKAKQDATVAMMEENPIVSLRIPINNIAKQVSLPDGKLLSDVIRFEGKTVETPIAAFGEKKAKTKKRSKKERDEEASGPQNLKVEQDFEFRDVPIDSLYDFLEKIEQSPELLFVTKLEIRRKFGDYDVAQNAFVTVTTYKRTGGS